MKIILDILFDFSPILQIFFAFLLFKSLSDKPFSGFFCYFYYFLSFVYGVACQYGYGNLVPVIIALTISILMWILLFLMCAADFFDYIFTGIFIFSVSFFNIINDLYQIYKRLKINNILEIEMVDKIIYNMKNINILNNVWTQGIVTGIISGVIGGIILEKIKNMKK